MTEEEAFWTFAQIVECFIPLDYYSNLFGALIDQKVIRGLVEIYLPKLDQHVVEYELDINMHIFKWLVVLLVGHLDPETEYAIWDLFFTKNQVIIFQVVLTVLEWMQDDILACNDDGDLFMLFKEKPQ